MTARSVLRVVVAKKGKVKPSEFRLRDGEIGLSVFRGEAGQDAQPIIDAVRAAGKQGELMVVDIPTATIDRLGLVIVATPGGTPDPAVNRLHAELRFPLWKRLLLRLRRKPIHEVFNETIAVALAAESKVSGGES